MNKSGTAAIELHFITLTLLPEVDLLISTPSTYPRLAALRPLQWPSADT